MSNKFELSKNQYFEDQIKNKRFLWLFNQYLLREAVLIWKKITFVIAYLNYHAGFLWYVAQRWLQFARLLTNTSILSSILIGLISIGLSIITIKYPENTYKYLSDSNKPLIIFISLIIFTAIAGRYFFNTQTPKQYADFSLNNKYISSSLTYISYCIWKTCTIIPNEKYLFSELAHIVDSTPKDIDRLQNHPPELTAKKIKRGKKITKRLERSINKKRRYIQRIDEMIKLLSKTINIPAYRLCDYFFQYSPDIYIISYRQMIRDLREIYYTLEPEYLSKQTVFLKTKESSDIEKVYTILLRRQKLAFDILVFVDSVYRRQTSQKLIIKNRSINDYLIESSLENGISSALRTYSLGLQKISEKYDTNISLRRKNEIKDRLTYMCKKRRLAPGFDLHSLLLNFSNKQFTTDSHLSYALRDLKTSTETQKKQDGDWPLHFKDLLSILNNAIYKQRIDIYTKLEKKITSQIYETLKQGKESFKEHNKINLVFITQGYSSVVNEAMFKLTKDKPGSEGTSPSFLEKIKTQLNSELKKEIDITYFILLDTDEFRQSEKSKARYTLLKFKESPKVDPNKDKLNWNRTNLYQIKIDSFDWFKKRYNNNYSICFLLSGAELIQCRESESKFTSTEEHYKLLESSGLLYSIKETTSEKSKNNDDLIKFKVTYDEYRIINDENVADILNLYESPSNKESYYKDALYNNKFFYHFVLAESFKEFNYHLDEETHSERIFKESMNKEFFESSNLYDWRTRTIIIGSTSE